MVAESTVFLPAEVDEAARIVRENRNLRPRGGGTKPALSSPLAEEHVVDMSKISGILEYSPQEFTISALAGTTIREIEDALAENGQYLPFDPPLATAGATLGGTLAAGLSGPGRRRFGGIRDFVLGVRFIDGWGNVVLGGGKVVKNAAGFDFPKLMAGSLGRLGLLTEATFKVFPRPHSTITLEVDCGSLAQALTGINYLNSLSIDLEALDLIPPGRLYIRIGGFADSFPKRIKRLQELLEHEGRLLENEVESQFWEQTKEFSWSSPEGFLVKIPMTLAKVEKFDEAMENYGLARCYSSGACLCWVAGKDSRHLPDIDSFLHSLDLTGLVLRGNVDYPILGAQKGLGFLRRIKEALDPEDRFLSFKETISESS